MSNKLVGTQTHKNLLAAFAGESQARMRYTLFASQAQKEGFEQIAAVFLETAENEKHHAKIYWSFLTGALVEITARYPAGATEDTLNNLRQAAAGEQEEWSTLYPHYGEIAQQEGFDEIAEKFFQIANIELTHRERYNTFIELMETDHLFYRSKAVHWVCRVCGHVHLGIDPPQACPVCGHPRGFFQLQNKNY